MSDSNDEVPQRRGGGAGQGAEGGGGDDALDPGSLPALFWEDMPENPEEHPDYMALQVRATSDRSAWGGCSAADHPLLGTCVDFVVERQCATL